MAVTYFDSATSVADNSAYGNMTENALTVTPPASMLTGDLVLLFVTIRSSTNADMAVNDGSGQTWNVSTVMSGSNVAVKLFWCVFNGTWSSSVVTVSYKYPLRMLTTGVGSGLRSGTTNQPRSAQMFVFRPSSTSNSWLQEYSPVNAQATSSATQALSSYTTTHNNVVNVGFVCLGSSVTWVSYSPNWVQMGASPQYRNTQPSNMTNLFEYQICPTSGTSTGVGDITISAAATGWKGRTAFYEV